MRGRRGFTLIETLVAVIIMTGGVIILANAWSGNLVRIEKARINNNIASLLERRMGEVDLEFRGRPVSEIPEEDEGDFGSDYKGYTWALRSQPFEMPDLSSIFVARDGGADDMLITVIKTVGEHIRQSVREVTVEVRFKSKKGRKLAHQATTYFVDYTKSIDIPGIGTAGASPAGGAGAGPGGGAGAPPNPPSPPSRTGGGR